jgi:hypothetical protein
VPPPTFANVSPRRCGRAFFPTAMGISSGETTNLGGGSVYTIITMGMATVAGGPSVVVSVRSPRYVPDCRFSGFGWTQRLAGVRNELYIRKTHPRPPVLSVAFTPADPAGVKTPTQRCAGLDPVSGRYRNTILPGSTVMTGAAAYRSVYLPRQRR